MPSLEKKFTVKLDSVTYAADSITSPNEDEQIVFIHVDCRELTVEEFSKIFFS